MVPSRLCSDNASVLSLFCSIAKTELPPPLSKRASIALASAGDVPPITTLLELKFIMSVLPSMLKVVLPLPSILNSKVLVAVFRTSGLTFESSDSNNATIDAVVWPLSLTCRISLPLTLVSLIDTTLLPEPLSES